MEHVVRHNPSINSGLCPELSEGHKLLGRNEAANKYSASFPPPVS